MSDSFGTGVGAANSLVVFDTVEYDVVAGPDASSPLAQSVQTAVLQALDIDRLVNHLDRTDDLLYIAACGVAGLVHPKTNESLSAQVMGLQYKLRKNTGDIGSALLDLGESARSMLSSMKAAFKDWYGLYEADAVTRLARCESVAANMAESAGKLEGSFQSLVDEASEALRLTSETCNLQKQESIPKQQVQLDVDAWVENIKAKRAGLELQLRKVQALRAEAKAGDDTADERVFMQAIVGQIAAAFGGGIPAPSTLKVASSEVGSELAAALAGTRAFDAEPQEEETEAPMADLRRPTEEAKKEKDAERAKKANKDETAPRATGAAAEAAETEFAAASTHAEDATSGYAATAATYSKEKARYLDMLIDLQEQEREALEAMAQKALQLGSAKDKEEVEEAAVVSLRHAVVTLEQMVLILAEHKRLWTAMATDYARLAQADLRTAIEGYMQKSCQERIEAYTKPSFQVPFLAMAAQWGALQRVAGEYRSAIQTAFAKMGRTYTKNPSIEEGLQLAPVLGAALAREVTAEIRLLNERTGQMAVAIAYSASSQSLSNEWSSAPSS